ncbi:MAG: hypothetical protein AVDCRST_MAG95-810 [uncultured Adhaeribacter sp.]|uniref:Uncharacterized protein n=1 Tax=uncultured Adhaeribacter sp. TaxID=448109 RepID=A0A6J4HK96_9BACT|nr:MAG: hypothetical protein AVDCRST_MAG95-810 [uncultured Adhaeribacter sp.]
MPQPSLPYSLNIPPPGPEVGKKLKNLKCQVISKIRKIIYKRKQEIYPVQPLT